MNDAPAYELEFLGGPYDGYAQRMEVPSQNLLELVSLPVNANVLRVINCEPLGPDVATCNVAVYTLSAYRGRPCYRFIECRPIQDAEWDRWCARICRVWQGSGDYSEAEPDRWD